MSWQQGVVLSRNRSRPNRAPATTVNTSSAPSGSAPFGRVVGQTSTERHIPSSEDVESQPDVPIPPAPPAPAPVTGRRPRASEDLPEVQKRIKLNQESLPVTKEFPTTGPHQGQTDLYSINLPKAMADLSKLESCAFIDLMQTPGDKELYEGRDSGSLRKACAQSLTQFLSLFSRVLSDINMESITNLRTELAKRALTIGEKDAALNAAARQISALEAKVHSLEAKVQDLETSRNQDRISAFNSGVQTCFRRLFYTNAGQDFLKSIHEGLISAYRKSSRYLFDMGPHIGHFVSHGFNFACDKASERGFIEDIDDSDLISTLEPSPAFEGDSQEPVDHPWWKEVIKSSVQRLINQGVPDPTLPSAENLIYDIDSASTSTQLITQDLPTLGNIADTAIPNLEESGTNQQISDTTRAS